MYNIIIFGKMNDNDFLNINENINENENINIFSLFFLIKILFFIIISFLIMYLSHQILKLVYSDSDKNDIKEQIQTELNSYTRDLLSEEKQETQM